MGITQKIELVLRTLAMKNHPKKGHSMRNGNRPAPYTKYKKRPYDYSHLKLDHPRRKDEIVEQQYKEAAE